MEVTIENAKPESFGEVKRILVPLIENGNQAIRINGHLYDASILEFHPRYDVRIEPPFLTADFFDHITDSRNTAWEEENGIVLKVVLSPHEPSATFFRILDICEEREWNYRFIESEGKGSVEVWALREGRSENSPL